MNAHPASELSPITGHKRKIWKFQGSIGNSEENGQNPLNFLLILAIFDGFSLARVVGRVCLEGEPP